jgi:hypothetical protein
LDIDKSVVFYCTFFCCFLKITDAKQALSALNTENYAFFDSWMCQRQFAQGQGDGSKSDPLLLRRSMKKSEQEWKIAHWDKSALRGFIA